MRRAILPLGLFLVLSPILSVWLLGQTDEQAWKSVPAGAWAEQAREVGDAVRGASIFYQPSLACATCHLSKSGSAATTGPALGHGQTIASADRLTDEQLVESILEPSKTIRKGYESSTIRTDEGEVITGIIVEKGDDLWSLRNANGELVRVKASEIESSSQSVQSLMPIGLVQQLSGRQQFLDLLKYLMEVRDGGPDRAKNPRV
jgi:putative heme-binding domain-containing protein